MGTCGVREKKRERKKDEGQRGRKEEREGARELGRKEGIKGEREG